MDVLVAGAGVGGLALARGLLDRGHRVRVLEAAPGLRRGGAAVTIFSNGAAALATLGVDLDGAGGRTDTLAMRTADGRRAVTADLRVLHRATGRPVTVVARERLIDRLAAGLPADLVRFATPVDRVEVHDGYVTVVDAAGGEHRADVLVGADGYRSAVRRAVLGDRPARDVGWSTWQGLGPVLPELAAGTTGLLLVGDAGLVGLMPAGGGALQWWFDTRWGATEPEPASAVAMLRERFGGYADPVPALLDAVTDADVGRYPHVLHDVPDVWGRGTTTLVGDAAHAFPPTQAQGANQAIEDAWLLGRLLDGGTDPVAALRRYERLRARRARLVARVAGTESTNKPLAAPVRLIAAALPPAVVGRIHLALIRRYSSVLSDER